MKLLLLLVLLLPKIASANYPDTYIVIGNAIYGKDGNYLIFTQEAVLYKDGFEFRHSQLGGKDGSNTRTESVERKD